MPEATNILLHDDSEQAKTLGDASLIAVLASISILHQMTGMFMTKSKKRRRDKIYQHFKRKQRTIQSLYQEYGGMFSRAYRMDYDVFMSLHELVKPGIDKYVCQNDNSNNEECFYRHNGAISSKIHLAVALWYFADGSYLDITISHGIGKTDVYCSVWAVVHAANNCTKLQFCFPTTVEECTEVASEFIFRSKAGFDNCTGCIDGMLIWTTILYLLWLSFFLNCSAVIGVTLRGSGLDLEKSSWSSERTRLFGIHSPLLNHSDDNS